MRIQELNMDNIEDIKKLMIAIFSREPWNDKWTDDQLYRYISELIGNKIPYLSAFIKMRFSWEWLWEK